MKLFILDAPYDYHEKGEVIVRANTAGEAAKKLLEKYPEADYYYGVAEYVRKPDLEQRLRVYDEDIYENEGCDC